MCVCMYVCMYVCTTEALEIKRAASSVCLRRIVALCGLGVYVVRPGVYGVPANSLQRAPFPCQNWFPRAFCGTNRLHYTHSVV